MEHLFYCYEHDNNSINNESIILDDEYQYYFWTPKVNKIIPEGLTFMPFFMWWLFHYLRIFSNNSYTLFLIYRDGKLVHRALVTPKYFRFPFMGKDDLQVGDIWTDPSYRRKGLSTFSILQIVKKYKGERKLWYLVEKSNLASVKLIEKLDFIYKNNGRKFARFGMNLLGEFRPNN